jgi:golgi-specific brefeldin A-resistance guanine nucleotide exchange factor 1
VRYFPYASEHQVNSNIISDITTLPIPILLDPFLALIKSQLSTGPITSVVLNSLSVFIHSGIIFIDGVDVVDALSTLSHAVAHCKFEASDVSGDEVVTLRILTVIHDCILSEAGQLLGDFEICEMLETVLTTACQIRLSGEHIYPFSST